MYCRALPVGSIVGGLNLKIEIKAMVPNVHNDIAFDDIGALRTSSMPDLQLDYGVNTDCDCVSGSPSNRLSIDPEEIARCTDEGN